MANLKYMYIGIEISALCNARCPWCFAIKTSQEVKACQGRGFMNFGTFKKVIERLEALGFLNSQVVVNLYAIGEPFLNKDLAKMFDLLESKSIKYGISTNASVPFLSGPGTKKLKNLSNLIISIPGFSQESYDRVHGFKFDKIRENIIRLITNFRKSGFKGDARLVYHVYQFNLDEIYQAREFAQENNLDFYPYYAILYERCHLRNYLSNTLAYDLLKRASKDLFLDKIEKTISSRPTDYKCDFFNMLLVDIDANLKTCCQIRKGDPGYSFGSLSNLSAEEIMLRRITQLICRECQNTGMDYYLSVYTPFNLYTGTKGVSKEGQLYEKLIKLLKQKSNHEVILFGAGKFGLKALKCLRNEGLKVHFFADNSPLKIGNKVGGVKVISPSDIKLKCQQPLVIVTTINYKQIMDQLAKLKIKPIHYLPIEVYSNNS